MHPEITIFRFGEMRKWRNRIPPTFSNRLQYQTIAAQLIACPIAIIISLSPSPMRDIPLISRRLGPFPGCSPIIPLSRPAMQAPKWWLLIAEAMGNSHLAAMVVGSRWVPPTSPRPPPSLFLKHPGAVSRHQTIMQLREVEENFPKIPTIFKLRNYPRRDYRTGGNSPQRRRNADFPCPRRLIVLSSQMETPAGSPPLRILLSGGRGLYLASFYGGWVEGLAWRTPHLPFPFTSGVVSVAEQGEISNGRPTKRGIIQDLLALLTDNHLISDVDAATMLAISPRIVRALRASDSFQAMLALRIERQHGDAIRAVRNESLLAAHDALRTARTIMQSEAALPSVKLAAAQLALDSHHKNEERLVPKNSQFGPHPGQQNVTINLSLDELTRAREASIAHGNTIELEPSDHAYQADILVPARLRARSSEGGDQV